MKELINKFKKLDQTKRIVILFVTISFVFIAGFSIYNGISGNYQNGNTAQVTQVKETKEKNTKKNVKIGNKKETKEDSNNQQEECTIKEENNIQESTEKKDESSNKETKKQPSKNNNNIKSSTSESKESTEENTNSNQSSNITTSNNTSTNANTSQNQNDNKITVSIQVIGVDSTMMSGNLSLEKNTSVYSALKTLASQKGVSISTSGFGASTYVRGIGGLKEFDYGGNSGWLYMVNGAKPNYGAYSYKLNDGDNIKWYYTTDYTKD